MTGGKRKVWEPRISEHFSSMPDSSTDGSFVDEPEPDYINNSRNGGTDGGFDMPGRIPEGWSFFGLYLGL